ncbi:MAG: bifunctional phosphoribosylaminoimidazolecarboxamide formyltransferase/IMP cyclohydrolase [Actinomycetota bacterium]|nr:bifunctional phosphoribosylaminoimidazolecarboxamide formyltransferase/IMP cyclohydrolase [Actinomycetota bacterium]
MTAPTRIAVRRALVSVYDKTGLEELARGLAAAGVEIVSTGSTAAAIASLDVAVTAVEDVTGFPEILGGRVKTLHPHIHAGLLADQADATHLETIGDLGIEPFQLVVSNLYPFRHTVASGALPAAAIEQIDIGGPSMVRASAKNHGSVAVVVDPRSYPAVLEAVRSGGFDLRQRQTLAALAFRHTASYDIAVAGWLGSELALDDESNGFPGWIGRDWERAAVLRYGENPHQQAALYVQPDGLGLAQADQLAGKEMSFNNYVDGDAAFRAAYDFAEPCVAIIKHANPCGIAVGADIAEAHRLANAGDPASAFGGVIAANQAVSVTMAEQVADVFTEVIIAPSYDEGAVELLTARQNLRVLVCAPRNPSPHVELKLISGGVLAQTADRLDAPGDDPATWSVAAGDPVDAATLADLAFAWRAIRAVRSNAILLATGRATVGIGMGQVNRVDAARLAVARAGDRARGCVAASDAFFPFADGLQVLVDAGVRAVVQPGGSKRDGEVIATAAAAGITMYFTGTRHFTH